MDRMIGQTSFCYSLGVVIAVASSSAAFDGGRATDEAVPEYGDALASLEMRFRDFSARAHHIRPDYQSDVEYFVKGNSFQSITEYGDEVRPAGYPKRCVRSVSPKTVFELASASLNEPYFIRFGGEEFRKTDLSYESKRSMPFVLAATHLFALSMRTIVDSPDTQVELAKAVEPVSAGDVQGDYEVTFVLNPSQCRFDRAVVTFARAAGWVVTAYRCYFDLRNQSAEEWAIYTGTVEYQDSKEFGGPVPRRVAVEIPAYSRSTTLQAAEAGAPTLREPGFETAEILEYRRGPVSEGQFTLGTFGVPDIAFDDPGQQGLFRGRALLIVAFCVSVALAVALVAVVRKRDKPE